MARPTIPAAVIQQRGKTIDLLDGSKAVVVFTFSSLMRVEEDFGSVQDALAAVTQGARGSAFTAVAQILAAGLEHENRDDGRLSDVEYLRALLDPVHFESYSDAVGAAIDAAFPSSDDTEAGESDADPQMDSRGESGTTSPSSSSEGERTSSGE
jgi:hypothetical protein